MQRTFQQIFKELRQEKGLTQAQLAERLNYTQGNISGWENGTVEPKATALTVIAEFFGVSIEFLLGVTDEFNMPIVAPMGDHYSAEERQLIEEYRKLPTDSKKLVLRMVGVSSTSQEAKKKA